MTTIEMIYPFYHLTNKEFHSALEKSFSSLFRLNFVLHSFLQLNIVLSIILNMRFDLTKLIMTKMKVMIGLGTVSLSS